jgi:nickel/cobalt transporter (NicO) family protein
VREVKTLPALTLAAAGVGFGHAVMPDHWMPLAVLSRTRRYTTRRTVRLSLAAGVAHVVVSLVLGGVLVVVGLQLRDTVSRHADGVIGGILLVTGMVFLAMELVGRGHGHSHDDGHGHGHEHGDEHGHEHGEHDHDGHHHAQGVATLERAKVHAEPKARRDARGVAAFLVPFGAAASPDLTILPVFLAAGALGSGAAIGSLTVFAGVTIATIVGLTTAAAAGAKLLTASWVDRGANLLTAGTLLLIGGLVATGLI